jgi:hypothetical protein
VAGASSFDADLNTASRADETRASLGGREWVTTHARTRQGASTCRRTEIRETGSGVAEVVRRERRQAQHPDGVVEGIAAEVAVVEPRSNGVGEDEIVRTSTGHHDGQLVDDEAGEGHHSAAVRPRGHQRGFGGSLGQVLGHLQARPA